MVFPGIGSKSRLMIMLAAVTYAFGGLSRPISILLTDTPFASTQIIAVFARVVSRGSTFVALV